MSDALTTLRAALAPKTGLRRIPLTLETYQHQSVQLSSKLLLNMFAEAQPADARSPVALVPTPGLATLVTVGAGPIHALNDDVPGLIYVVSGTHFFKLDNTLGSWAVTDLGEVGFPSGPVGDDNLFYSIAANAQAAVVCVPPNAYVSAAGAPVSMITTTWPDTGASSVTYLDGYFVFTSQRNPEQFFISRLLNPSAINALDFASFDAFPNAVRKVMTLGSDLWFAGETGWEIWYDAGNVDFPFRRRPGGILQRPVASPKSVTKGDERLFWMSSDGRVYGTVGYQEERISTHGIEARLPADAVSAMVFAQRGHIHYVLNLSDRTLIYDTITKVWHNGSSAADGTGRWRGSCASANHLPPIIGDAMSGQLLTADGDLSTEVGIEVRRQVVLPPLASNQKRIFCSRLEIELEVGTAGTPPEVTLEWSNDGGLTYPASRVLQCGAVGQTRWRVYTTRLGSFRNRVFRVTAQHAMTIYAVDADVAEGAS